MQQDPVLGLEKLMTTTEVARLFSVKHETVRTWLEKGHINGVKILGYWKISEASVIAFMNRRHGSEA